MSEVYCIINRAVVLSDPTPKIQLQTPLAYNNALAHCMRVTLYNEDGTDADLTDVGVVASVMNADGDTISPINGTTSGNTAEVILPTSCYVTPGRFRFTMNLSKTGGYTRTVLWVEGMVERNVGGTIIDPGTPVGNIEQAVGAANAAASAASEAAAEASEAAEAAESVVSSSVRYDTAQSLSGAQKAQGRANIGAVSITEDDTENGLIVTY